MGRSKIKDIVERFWSKVEKRSKTKCWIWNGTRGKRYGQFWDGKRRAGAHRFSWELFHNKKIPEGMYICHTCDNIFCVNPHHLFLGTQFDNMRDMVNKKRCNNRGENNGRSKLTEADVVAIRSLYNNGLSGPKLSVRFGVTHQVIYRILSRKLWGYV